MPRILTMRIHFGNDLLSQLVSIHSDYPVAHYELPIPTHIEVIPEESIDNSEGDAIISKIKEHLANGADDERHALIFIPPLVQDNLFAGYQHQLGQDQVSCKFELFNARQMKKSLVYGGNVLGNGFKGVIVDVDLEHPRVLRFPKHDSPGDRESGRMEWQQAVLNDIGRYFEDTSLPPHNIRDELEDLSEEQLSMVWCDLLSARYQQLIVTNVVLGDVNDEPRFEHQIYSTDLTVNLLTESGDELFNSELFERFASHSNSHVVHGMCMTFVQQDEDSSLIGLLSDIFTTAKMSNPPRPQQVVIDTALSQLPDAHKAGIIRGWVSDWYSQAETREKEAKATVQQAALERTTLKEQKKDLESRTEVVREQQKRLNRMIEAVQGLPGQIVSLTDETKTQGNAAEATREDVAKLVENIAIVKASFDNNASDHGETRSHISTSLPKLESSIKDTTVDVEKRLSGVLKEMSKKLNSLAEGDKQRVQAVHDRQEGLRTSLDDRNQNLQTVQESQRSISALLAVFQADTGKGFPSALESFASGLKQTLALETEGSRKSLTGLRTVADDTRKGVLALQGDQKTLSATLQSFAEEFKQTSKTERERQDRASRLTHSIANEVKKALRDVEDGQKRLSTTLGTVTASLQESAKAESESRELISNSLDLVKSTLLTVATQGSIDSCKQATESKLDSCSRSISQIIPDLDKRVGDQELARRQTMESNIPGLLETRLDRLKETVSEEYVERINELKERYESEKSRVSQLLQEKSDLNIEVQSLRGIHTSLQNTRTLLQAAKLATQREAQLVTERNTEIPRVETAKV
ncbi:hypothetical protein FHETE_5337 [Fusarium heterosporum]|uniref:Uncharacterized protein n=1 Tax=Fusarium heterosporum TaxID=42747 RepID=A0A8H5WQ44_FUSHE|nr:hypothetical protein FHETE_5337 [Fusarium heterosporum]